jgi:DNA mismatch repair ATPase MutS
MGFYRHCVLYHPYTQFYTYLNIPDTSDRDSLFQAEVRRGKEILDAVSITATAASKTPNNNFLLMDELFSGTNHDDAVQAAYGFLCYLGHPTRQSSTRFLLTTHFVEICDKIQSKAPHVAKNGKMIIEEIGFVNLDTDFKTDKPEEDKKEKISEEEKPKEKLEEELEEETEEKEEEKKGEKSKEKELENKIPESPEPEEEKPREIGEIGEIKYLYQFKEGISRLRCGIHILKQMKYPTEVMCYL